MSGSLSAVGVFLIAVMSSSRNPDRSLIGVRLMSSAAALSRLRRFGEGVHRQCVELVEAVRLEAPQLLPPPDGLGDEQSRGLAACWRFAFRIVYTLDRTNTPQPQLVAHSVPSALDGARSRFDGARSRFDSPSGLAGCPGRSSTCCPRVSGLDVQKILSCGYRPVRWRARSILPAANGAGVDRAVRLNRSGRVPCTCVWRRARRAPRPCGMC